MHRKRLALITAITLITTLAAKQVTTHISQRTDETVDAVSILSAEPQRLTEEFARLASAGNRRPLVSFLKGELMPYLTSAVILYPLADSVGGTGGYAVAAALFDGETIARQVRELERLERAGDSTAFRARTVVLTELLDLYFTKERLLIAPALAALSASELHALAARIKVRPTSSSPF